MRRVITVLFICGIAAIPSLLLAQNDKRDKDKKDRSGRDEPVMTPQLAAFKKAIESWPTDKLRHATVAEKKSLEQWARKNNFDPPGNEYDRDKAKAGKRGKGGKGKVAISKRQEAELMAQFLPWKAKIDVMEEVLRAHEHPKKDGKDARPKKEK